MKTVIHENLVRFKSSLALLKSALAVCGLLIMLPVAQAQFTWPVYEPFGEYTNGTPIGVTNATTGSDASPWWGSIGNGVSTNGTTVFDYAALSYPAFADDTNSSPKGLRSAIVTGSRDAAAPFSPHAGTIYASFLINNINTHANTADRMFFSLNTGTSASGGFGMSVYLTPDYRLKIRKFPSGNPSGTFSAATPVLTTNATHLIVIRYQTNIVAGAPGEVALWLDPTPFGDDASIPAPTISTTNGANVASFQLLVVPSRGAGTNTFYMDEIRLGDTWASVTPLAGPAPGPLFAVTGGGNGCAGDTFPIGLNGSVTTNDYLLYTNAVYAGVTLPGTGSALDFGAQNTVGYYSVLASNTVTGDIGWMSNSPIISIKASAAIVAQPVPITVATNNRAEFKLSATGDFLSFQWYKDGVATPLTDGPNLTGSTSNVLVIWPATEADIGSYYNRVSDTCGHVVFSTTNALNLTAPSDLVWVGDAFNICVWDVFAANAEWSGGTGFFNPGDNVTFDDTYTFANPVTLNGVLTPSKIMVNASRDYNWAGAGRIAGSTALVKDGPGRLNLNGNGGAGFANTYTGGTIISNGVLSITNSWLNLGTGPVTLAGGTLANWVKGNAGGPGVEQGLTNNMFVTANSTWQLDRTGDQAAALLGSLNGNLGTTLNFYHSATNHNSVNRVRLGGVFTNGLAITASANPLAINSPLDIGTYNSTGVQVYNGVISGENTGFLVVGAGEVYLNAANTFTRDTTIFVGFLAGSGSIKGQLVVNAGTAIGGGAQDAIGTFTVNSNVVLNGNVRIRVDKSLAQSNDVIVATGYITNGGVGTVMVTNIGVSGLVEGDSFQIFSGAVDNGDALAVTGGGVNWVNNLAVDGSIQVGPAIADYPTNISYSVSDGTLTITWPETHQGWILQSQTNDLNVGIATNWYDIVGSNGGTNQNISVNPADPTVFYRLRSP